VTADLRLDTGLLCPPLDHPESVIPGKGLRGEPSGFQIGRSEQGPFLVLSDPGRCNVAIEILLEDMVHRHLVVLAAFLVPWGK
jgi:hypothetical protein